MHYSAVIFDLFGTLVEDFASSVGQTQTAFVEALAVPYEPFTQLWRPNNGKASHWAISDHRSKHRIRLQSIGRAGDYGTNDEGGGNPIAADTARSQAAAECRNDTRETKERRPQTWVAQQLLNRDPYPLAGNRIRRLCSKPGLLLPRTPQET